MGTSAIQDDPMLRLRYYHETGQTDEAQKYEQYLRETGQYKAPATPYTIHDEYKSGQLAKRMGAANEADQADAETEPGYLGRLATHALNTGQGMPGMEMLEAGAGAAGSKLTDHPIDYATSLATLRDKTDSIGGGASWLEHVAGGLPMLPFLPANPMKAGALLGASGSLLSADPVSSPEDMLTREGKTAGMGLLGGLLGKSADMAESGVRASAVGTPAAQMFDKMAARTASAKRLYDAALAEGKGKPFTPALKAFVAEPEVAEIVSELQSTSHKGVPAESPEMLDALYKVLSDRAGVAQKGLDAVSPTRANIGRFRLQGIRQQQEGLLDQMSGGSSLPGPMPTYRNAVADFAKRTADMKALGRGSDQLMESMTGKLVGSKQLMKKTPEAFADWANTASPSEIAAAKSGILGQTGAAFGLPGKTFGPGRRAMNNAGSLLRMIDPNDLSVAATRLGLLGMNSLR